MIKGILFDLDGVIVNSEVYDQQIIESFIMENHYKTDPKIFRLWIGGSDDVDYWSIFKNLMHPDDDFEAFRMGLNEYHRKRKREIYFPPMAFPDSAFVIRQLRYRGLKLACCSSSAPWYIERALQQLQIRNCFDLVLSGYDFKHSKPDPEIYLLALKKLGLNKEEALVIEDSPYGIKAGNNAEIKVLARRDRQFDMDQSGADELIDDLYGIFEFL